MDIQEIMSGPAVTCRPSDMLNTAAQLMWDHDCGAVPVVNDDGSIVGMITDRDICMAAYTQGGSIQAIPVSNAMAKQIFFCHAEDSVDAVERLMSDKQVRRVPIVDGGNRPIGIVSLSDIARYAAWSRKRNGLDREVTQTLAAICQPRPEVSEGTKAQPTVPHRKM